MSEVETQPINGELVWADTVMLVFSRYGDIVREDNIEGSKTAKRLHDWVIASADNETKFITTMVKQATEIIAKYRKTENDGQIELAEKRTILDLKLRLAEAVEESDDVKP